MILTLNDKREISQIIASFTDEDYERINSEVDRPFFISFKNQSQT
jgi:hypothetical protein